MSEEKQFDYENDDNPFIVAYEMFNGSVCESCNDNAYELIQASKDTQRDWMDKTTNRFSYRCLPLIAANSIGWQVKANFGFVAIWNGESSTNAIQIKYSDSIGKRYAFSHFGSGIITFTLPWLFRTSRGHNLFITGPINVPKEHITPLSGIVETDWLPFTFTMNWQITTPNVPVVFQPGEVVCQFFPYPRGYIEKFTALTEPIKNNKEIEKEYNNWHDSRRTINSKISDSSIPQEERRKIWEKNYFQGVHKDGTKFEEHQVKISACPFMNLPRAKEQ